MKTILFALLLLSSLQAFGQVVVDGVNINERADVRICQVVATGKLFSEKVTINIDYGQPIRWASNKGTRVTDSQGRPIVFNSTIAAVNYMENNGWQYVDSYTLITGTGLSQQPVYHYLFRRSE